METAPEIVRDYAMIRSVGLGLTLLAFLAAAAQLGTNEMPHERAKAQGLLITSLLAFLFMAGDRMIAHGLAEWFSIPVFSLPVFWQ